MEAKLAIISILAAILGCGEQQPASEQSRAGARGASAETGPNEGKKWAIIGEVVFSKSSLVEGALGKEGIPCITEGSEGYTITVPAKDAKKAKEVLARDAEKNGYTIRWRSP